MGEIIEFPTYLLDTIGTVLVFFIFAKLVKYDLNIIKDKPY